MGSIKLIPKQKTFLPDYNLIPLQFTIQITEQYRNFLRAHPDIKTELIIGVFNDKDLVKEYKTGTTAQQIANQTKPFEINLINLPKGSNEVRLGIKSKDYLITHNSETIHIIGL